jgi:hypothetical protein
MYETIFHLPLSPSQQYLRETDQNSTKSSFVLPQNVPARRSRYEKHDSRQAFRQKGIYRDADVRVVSEAITQQQKRSTHIFQLMNKEEKVLLRTARSSAH